MKKSVFQIHCSDNQNVKCYLLKDISFGFMVSF